jgi:uncharacterized membrane protein
MRNCAFIFIFIFSFCFAHAQNTGNNYYYTRTSEQYLSSDEIDSIVKEEAVTFLKQQSLPEDLVEQISAVLIKAMFASNRQSIILAFKKIENENKIKQTADKTSPQYAVVKDLYANALRKQINNSFGKNTTLSKFNAENKSDRITWFNSVVRVGTDGKLLVQENITVYNGSGQINTAFSDEASLREAGLANNEIKRGIVRAFPLYYINSNHLFQNTTFKLKEVLLDGKKEDYHTESQENGILVYTGSEYVFLKEGSYSYRITYETDHQLKMLKDYDELYWNVTGNGWSFRIDSAMCTVILPKGANVLSNTCYTGLQGAAESDCNITSSIVGDSVVIVFKTTRPLLPYHGITIATSWQKGIVAAPTAGQQLSYYFWNNKAVFFMPFAALFSAVFCFIFWFKYGRDPKKGVIYPMFEPPAGFSPAALGYIFNQSFSQKLTASAIVDAAVRNVVKIEVKQEGLLFKHNKYIISKSNKPEKPRVSKYEDFNSQISDLMGTTIEKGQYNSDLGSLNSKVKSYCEETYKSKDGWRNKTNKKFFALNNSYTTLPVLVCFVAAGWAFFDGVIRAFQLSDYWQIGYFVAGVILCIIVLNIFANLLKAYSPDGRSLVDKTEGFKMFLTAADEKRFDMMSPPKKSLELYEKYLPFAIALDCEIEWGKKFEEIISTAIISGAAASCFSQSFTHDSQNFSTSFASSFSGAISSASTPPSSSSSGGGSSFGGGSSGGGGGGGGGGGW